MALPPAPFVRIEGVSKAFPGAARPAVDGVSLELRRGELFSLLGPSGCGKTTLLRIVAGLEAPEQGRVFIDGTDMTRHPPYERPVNMVFQSYALFPHMTVEANLAFGLKQDRVPRREIRARVAEALALVRLEGYGGRKPHQLSGGERQRVALARALVKRPKILLLDEPLAALDKRLREHTRFELVTLQREVGITFLMVTHDQEEAMAMSSRIGVMTRGALVQVGQPSEIYERPASREVAEFVGAANLFDGRVVAAEGEGGIVRSSGPDLEIRVASRAGAEVGAAVTVMVRPEKITLHQAPPPSGLNAVAGRVVEVGYLGDMSILHVRLACGHMVEAFRLNRHAEPTATAGPGDAVHVAWPSESGVVLAR